MNVIDGGDFGSGFASGAVSSLISSGVQRLHIKGKDFKNVLTIASGGLSGGISASIAGGNFWAGVRQGLITSGLNHMGHLAIQPKTKIIGIYGAGYVNNSQNKELKKN